MVYSEDEDSDKCLNKMEFTQIPCVKVIKPEEDKNPNPKIISKFTTKQWQVLAALLFGDFGFYSGVSILAPFFPAEASKKNVSSTVVGFIFGVSSLVTFIASPYMGVLISKFEPKLLLCCGAGIAGVCNVLFGLSDKVETTELFTIYCFGVRILEGLGAAAYVTASYTFIAQIFPDDKGFVLGGSRIIIGVGMSLGPALGGFLFDIGGYGLPFFMLGALFILINAVFVVLLPAHKFHAADEEQSLRNLWTLFTLPPILLISMSLLVASTVDSFLYPTLEPHLREFKLTAKELGLSFVLLSTTYALSSPIFGYISDKISVKRRWYMIFIGLFGWALSLTLLGPSPIIGIQNNMRVNLLALGLAGTFSAITLIPTFEMLIQSAISYGYPDGTSTYGLVGGLWTSAYSLGEIIGPTVGAILVDNFAFPIGSSIMAGSCLVVGITFFLYFNFAPTNKDTVKVIPEFDPLIQENEDEDGLLIIN